MKLAFFSRLAIMFCLLGLFHSGMVLARTFTNNDGKTFEGEILKIQNDSIVVERSSDHRPFTVPISSLSSEDQKYVTEWRKQHPDFQLAIDVQRITGKPTYKKDSHSKWTTRDFCFEITIKNQGKAPVPALDLKYFQYSSPLMGFKPDSIEVPPLDPGKSTAVRTKTVILTDYSSVSFDSGTTSSGQRYVVPRVDKHRSKSSLDNICLVVRSGEIEVAHWRSPACDEDLQKLRRIIRKK